MFSLQGKDASKLAGNWFQLLIVLFTKEYLPTSFFAVYGSIMKIEAQSNAVSDRSKGRVSVHVI